MGSEMWIRDRYGWGGIYINYMKLMNTVYKFHSYLPWNIKQHECGIIMVKEIFCECVLLIFIGYVQFNLYLCW